MEDIIIVAFLNMMPTSQTEERVSTHANYYKGPQWVGGWVGGGGGGWEEHKVLVTCDKCWQTSTVNSKSYSATKKKSGT